MPPAVPMNMAGKMGPPPEPAQRHAVGQPLAGREQHQGTHGVAGGVRDERVERIVSREGHVGCCLAGRLRLKDRERSDCHARQAGRGRAEFLKLLSPSSTVSHATGLRIVSFPRSPGQYPSVPCYGVADGDRVHVIKSTRPGRRRVFTRQRHCRRPAVSPATPRRTWIHPGRVPHQRAGPGRTLAPRWPGVRCGADRPGRSPRSPGSTSPGRGCGPR